jgi:hypothetical protein
LWDCLNVKGIVGVVAQRLAHPVNGLIEAAVEIDGGIGPKPIPEFFAGNDLAGVFERESQGMEGLVLKLNLAPLLEQFSGDQVGFEGAKANKRPGAKLVGPTQPWARRVEPPWTGHLQPTDGDLD